MRSASTDTMRHALHTAALSLLLLAYVTTSSVLALSFLASMVTGGGTVAVASCDGRKPDLPRTSFVQRRHMPLVKHLTLSPVVPSIASCGKPDVDAFSLQHAEAQGLPTAPLLCGHQGRSPPKA